ncbi:FAD dependent oxidoreductase [Shewanella sp. MR-4]|uniref:NAD(P)/FAD-dependent oxidoreductase n=1 Tax=Shewanella sp. (strain MR-4) TaxID=60480 RepID=UPI00005E535B|nr:FAD-dependent oxidoreductase [Shewanella sp. MR-4]ABI37959.1 FAD dependent oxidoreductase [Shewanella sp. MR-4]
MKERGFWFDTEPKLTQRAVLPPLEQDISADVAIIGAGYSGLWTAYYLKLYQPNLSVVILEAERIGQGASGRNGGWLMGSFSGDVAYLNRLEGEQRLSAKAIIQATISEVATVCAKHHIDCDLHHGGNLRVAARYSEQLANIKAELAQWRAEGFGEEDIRWLDKTELDKQVSMAEGQAALFTPHCARIHPAKLVCGLADLVQRLGVKIYEHTLVNHMAHLGDAQTLLQTPKGRVRATIVVPAVEGYLRQLSGLGRFTLPVQSLLIATEPLTDATWDAIGLANRATFSDASRIVTYGQRSPDNRLIFGARGGYGFGAEIRTEFGFDPKLFNGKFPANQSPPQCDFEGEFGFRYQLLLALFPQLNGVQITHGWGGTLALARRFAPHAIFDQSLGLGLIGGYGGEGVGAANLFARTLVDLILGRDTQLASMPWAFNAPVQQVLAPWEREPLPWLAYHGMNKIFAWEDRLYSQPKSAAWQKGLAKRFANRLEGLMS